MAKYWKHNLVTLVVSPKSRKIFWNVLSSKREPLKGLQYECHCLPNCMKSKNKIRDKEIKSTDKYFKKCFGSWRTKRPQNECHCLIEWKQRRKSETKRSNKRANIFKTKYFEIKHFLWPSLVFEINVEIFGEEDQIF